MSCAVPLLTGPSGALTAGVPSFQSGAQQRISYVRDRGIELALEPRRIRPLGGGIDLRLDFHRLVTELHVGRNPHDVDELVENCARTLRLIKALQEVRARDRRRETLQITVGRIRLKRRDAPAACVSPPLKFMPPLTCSFDRPNFVGPNRALALRRVSL